MDILVLSSLARVPMHGYELKLELRYRHVRWWAKVEHGHLYATLQRLRKKGLIEEAADPQGPGKATKRERQVYAVTERGMELLEDSLRALAESEDQSYFDLDVFLSGSYLLDQHEVVRLLESRRAHVAAQLAAAERLRDSMTGRIPLQGSIIIGHRIDFLRFEVEFAENAAKAVAAAKNWGPFLGSEKITEFLARTGTAVESA